MKKGFTLIELLAVIVILAIIATIAVPIVLSIIEDTKESTTLRNAEYYLDAVEQSIAKQSLNTGSAYQPKECEIQLDGNIVCDGEVEVIVEVKGAKPSGGTITFEEGKIINISLTIENKVVIQNENNELVIGESNNSICTLKEGEPNALGSKYQCKVKDDMEEDFEDGYYFYVLSHEDDGTTNLIMDRNINSDGTLATKAITYAQKDSNGGIYNLVAWVSKEDYNDDTNFGSLGNTNKGPITAINFLYNATKDWSNIPNIVINYTDEGNTGSYGYGDIKTEDNKTQITKKDGTVTATDGNLKARLPYHSEVADSNGTNEYLYHNLDDYFWQGVDGKQPTNNISKIYGYWTLSSVASNSFSAWSVEYYGKVSYYDVGSVDTYGVRPVINVKL